MNTYTIKFNEILDIKKFVRDMQLYDVSMTVTSLDGKKMINPKSIMGMFTLDLSKPVVLSIWCENIDVIKSIKDDIKQYEV